MPCTTQRAGRWWQLTRWRTAPRSAAYRVAVAAGLLGVVGLITGAALSFAASSRDRVVARVGGRAITVAQLETRMAKLPPFQLRMLGDNADDIRHEFLHQLITVELMVAAARADGLDRRPEQRDRIRAVLKTALLNQLHQEALDTSQPSDDEVKAFYERNRGRYAAQLRLKLWRITVRTREQAQEIIDTTHDDPKYRKDPVAGWDALARARSLDKATSKRKGNLGFVRPDGSTAQADVRVSPKLFEAALRVKNGQVVPEPVRDGSLWAVVQRRGSHQTPERTLAAEAPAIRKTLAKQRIRARIRELVEQLRKRHVGDVHLERLADLEITRAGMGPRRRPGALRRGHPAAGSPVPRGAPGRLR